MTDSDASARKPAHANDFYGRGTTPGLGFRR